MPFFGRACNNPLGLEAPVHPPRQLRRDHGDQFVGKGDPTRRGLSRFPRSPKQTQAEAHRHLSTRPSNKAEATHDCGGGSWERRDAALHPGCLSRFAGSALPAGSFRASDSSSAGLPFQLNLASLFKEPEERTALGAPAGRADHNCPRLRSPAAERRPPEQPWSSEARPRNPFIHRPSRARGATVLEVRLAGWA